MNLSANAISKVHGFLARQWTNEPALEFQDIVKEYYKVQDYYEDAIARISKHPDFAKVVLAAVAAELEK